MSGAGDSIRQDASGAGAVAAQIVGDNNALTIIAAGTELVLDPKQRRANKRPPKIERELLMTEWRATTLVGRRPELDSFKAWRDDPAPAAMRCLTGKAGSGKTRLAIEACEEAEKDDWAAGFLTADELTRFHRAENLARWHSPKPALIVIDDAAVSVAMIRTWFAVLAQGLPDKAGKLRILLLERHAEPNSDYGWWATLKRIESRDSRGAGDLIGDTQPELLATLAAPAQRRALFEETMQIAAAMRGILDPPPSDPKAETELERRIADAPDREPLYLMMAAIVAIDRGKVDALTLSRVTLALHVAHLERARLERLGASRGLDSDGDVIAHLAACITLQRGCDFSTAKATVAEELQALGCAAPLSSEQLAMLLAEALPVTDGSGIDRVRPDLIGEAFALKEIIGKPVRTEAERFAIVERAHAREPGAVLETLVQCAQDFAGGAADHPSVRWLSALADRSDNLGELMLIATALPETTLALRELGTRLAENIIAGLRQMVDHPAGLLTSWLISLGARLTALGRREDALAAEQEALARSRREGASDAAVALILSNLAVSLSDLGQREEALALAEEAVALRRALAEASPETYTPDLAMSLNNLAVRLSDIGQREEALAAAEETVALYRALAEARPDAFPPNLAGALNNLATFLSALGRREAALAAAEEAVALYHALAEARPDAFTPDLAMSLNNLASFLSALGRRKEALTAAEEAMALYRVLAEARPDAFTPDLATSLNNMAGFLSDLGQRERALAAAEEACVLRRSLAAARPDAFISDLSKSLNNLANFLSDLGRDAEALAAAEEAVSLRRALAEARPDAFTPDLAGVLNSLARFLSALGRHEEALAVAEEAVALYRALVEARPDAFTPDLAGSLNNLANRLNTLGRPEAALPAAEEAVALYRALAEARPDAFTPNLATSYGAMGRLLEDLGRPADAMRTYGEALSLMLPYFLVLPDAHGRLIVMLGRDYVRAAELSGIEPDWDLLGQLAEKLKTMASNEENNDGD